MPWFQEFNAAFFLSMGTLIFGFGGVIINGMFKSKCKKCKLCCVEIERDIEIESKEDELALERHHATPPGDIS